MQKISLDDVRTMAGAARADLWVTAASVGRDPVIFLHWSAGHYGQPFPDYHINIDQDGALVTSVATLNEKLAHTWHQNSGAVGVSLLCCAFATPKNLGAEPPTDWQIEAMAQVVAVLCRGIGIPCDFHHVRTHAEQADIDGYGPATTCERWDLWLLHNGDAPGTGGDTLRGKAVFYQEQDAGSAGQQADQAE